jgi:hypothetical protein
MVVFPTCRGPIMAWMTVAGWESCSRRLACKGRLYFITTLYHIFFRRTTNFTQSLSKIARWHKQNLSGQLSLHHALLEGTGLVEVRFEPAIRIAMPLLSNNL